MNRVRIRSPKSLIRRPYRARRAPAHQEHVEALLADIGPAPRGVVILVGLVGLAVSVELVLAVAVTL